MNKNRKSSNQPVQWHTLSDDLMNLSNEKKNAQPQQEAETGRRTFDRSIPEKAA